MHRGVRTAAWVLFAATMYLIMVETVWPWVRLPGLGNVGFTAVFVLFALTHCMALEGWRRTAAFFAISAVVSYGMEEVGVRTGRIYGAYHYSDLLGAKLGHVPIIIPLAWFMMIYPSWMVAREMLRGLDTRRWPGLTALAAVAALVMTAWDVVMDPGMAAAGNWIWENGGGYFGVPRRNYLGWLLTTFLVYWIAGWALPRVRQERRAGSATRGFEVLPVIVYAFFAVRYVASNRVPALQLIALFSMGIPGLVAVLRIFLTKTASADEPLEALQ